MNTLNPRKKLVSIYIIIIVIFVSIYIIFSNDQLCILFNIDTEFITNGVTKKNDKSNVKGKKRRKCLRDKTAPRPPHSGKYNKMFQYNCHCFY